MSPVLLSIVNWPYHASAFLCEPCAAALQLYDCCIELDDETEWLQFLVRTLLLEQWGLEVQGEVWFQGTVCLVHIVLRCLTCAVTSSSAWAP